MPTESIWNELLGLAVNGLLPGFVLDRPLWARQPRGLAAGLATAVVFWTASTLGLETLGAFGAISLGPMLAWAGLIARGGGVVRWLRASGDQDCREEASPRPP